MVEDVKKASLVGVVSLISRSFLIQGISLAAAIILPLYLDPGIFGLFYLVSAFVNFFTYFSDIGLAAALIQKKDKLEESDLQTTFTIQQLLVITLLILIFFLSPLARRWYGLNHQTIILLYAIGFSFFLSSLKTIPSILLERNLKFNLLIIPQVLEALVFNSLLIYFAWKGVGINSFTYAVLARGLVGLAAMYLIAPWRIGFAFSRKSFRELTRFGVPYQINTMIAVVKDDLMVIVLGRIIGAAGLGYIGWAKKWAETPLRFLMDNVSKVAFPAFSRMQDDKANLKKSVEKALFFLTFLTFPILVGLSVFASDFIREIPHYQKWEPALIILYLYAFNSAWATISTSMTNLLNSIGQVKKTFKLMVMWLLLTWALMPIMGMIWGYLGVAVAAALIALSSTVAVYVAHRQVAFNIWGPVGKPMVSALIMGLSVYFIRPNLNFFWLEIIIRILAGLIIYLLFSYLLIGPSLVTDVQKIYAQFRKKQ